LKIQFNPTEFSHLDLVQSGIGKSQITAARYCINLNGYDFQWIAGHYKGDPTLGFGWAGNIKEAGFKGEAQYYFDNHDTTGQLNATVGFDYMFKKGWYLNTGFLYNSLGLDQNIQNGQNLNLQLSAKNLMPTKYNILMTVQKKSIPSAHLALQPFMHHRLIYGS